MELKTLQLHGNRRLMPIAMKCVVAVGLLLCTIAIASAGNETRTTVTIYTDDDMKAAQEIIDASGVGLIIALIALTAQYAPYLAVALLILLAIFAKMANNTDAHKGAIQGVILVIVIMFVWVIAIAIISKTSPDISTITFGG